MLYIAFVATPLLVAGVNAILEPLGLETMRTRDFPLLWRAIVALMIGYSAFIAEVFRAGIQAVDKGQIEAAEALRDKLRNRRIESELAAEARNGRRSRRELTIEPAEDVAPSGMPLQAP